MTEAVNHNIDWVTDESGNLVGYEVAKRQRRQLPPEIVVSTDDPVDADGRPDGTIYIQVA